MTAYFVGGALGSLAATRIAAAHGWRGVCLLGGGLSVALLAAMCGGELTRRRR
jgi:hypothetical protein